MRKLLYLNEFSKRIYKYTSIEDIARLTAFIIQRIFNIKCFAFFLKEEKKLVPIFWFACCKHKKQDDINETLQTLTKKIFYKRRVS